MNFTRILPSLLLALALGCASAQDVPEADTPSITPEAALLDMKSAAQRRDSARLQALLTGQQKALDDAADLFDE